MCDLGSPNPSGGLMATKAQILHRLLVKYGDRVSEPRFPSV